MVKLRYGVQSLEQLIANLEPVDLSALASDHPSTVRAELRRIRHNAELFLSLIANAAPEHQHPSEPGLREVLDDLRRECLLLRRCTLAGEILSFTPLLRTAFLHQVDKSSHEYRSFACSAHSLYLLMRPALAGPLQSAL